ncbi:MAG: AAA family ATPase [Steroidobacteraceae bacterium]
MSKPLVDVIVLDTMSSVIPGGNENSGEDVGKLIEHCKFLHRETGALVILVHHAGKNEEKGARGWSGLRAAADVEISVARNGEYHSARITKMKDGNDNAQYHFKLKTVQVGVDAEGEEMTSCVIEFVPPPEAPRGKRAATGPQKTTLETVEKMSLSGESVAIADVVEAVIVKTPKPSGRDGRRRKTERNIESLVENGWLFLDGDQRVSRVPIQAQETKGFDI